MTEDLWGQLRSDLQGSKFNLAKLTLEEALDNKHPQFSEMVDYYTSIRDKKPNAVWEDEINFYIIRNWTKGQKETSIKLRVNSGLVWGNGPSESTRVIVYDQEHGCSYPSWITKLVVSPICFSDNQYQDLLTWAPELMKFIKTIHLITMDENVVRELKAAFPGIHFTLNEWF